MDFEELFRQVRSGPEEYAVRSELADDPLGAALARAGFEPPQRAPRFQPERREDARFGPLSFDGDSIDAMIEGLSQSAREFRPRNFGEGLARGVVRGLTAGPQRRMQERDARNEAGMRAERAADASQDSRLSDLRAAAVRMAIERSNKRREAARTLPVPSTWAHFLKRPELVGRQLPVADWDALKEDFEAAVGLRPKPAKADPWEGMSARDRWELEKFDKREAQITARIDRWKQSEMNAYREPDREKARAEIARLEAELDRLYSERDAKTSNGAGGKSSASAAGSAPPSKPKPAASPNTAAFIEHIRKRGVKDQAGLAAELARQYPGGGTVGDFAKESGVDLEAVLAALSDPADRARSRTPPTTARASSRRPESSRTPTGRPLQLE